jgi:hypothetical protein
MSKGKTELMPAESGKTGELEISNFKALTVPAKQLVQTLQNNLSGQSLKMFDLDRVKVPSGGMIAWEVPSLQGPQVMQSLEGIILLSKDNRSYWDKKYGSGGGSEPPTCSSADMSIGVGLPGGDCLKCPMAQFGSAVDEKGQPGKGQACKHVKLMLFLREQDMIPLLISIPPSSVKVAQKYFLRLAGAAKPYQTVTTILKLRKERSSGGVEYAEVDFSMGRELNSEEVKNCIEISMALKDVFVKATAVRADVTGA